MFIKQNVNIWTQKEQNRPPFANVTEQSNLLRVTLSVFIVITSTYIYGSVEIPIIISAIQILKINTNNGTWSNRLCNVSATVATFKSKPTAIMIV